MNRDEGVRTPVRGDRDERYDSLQRAHTTWDAYQDHYEHRLGMLHEVVVAAWNALQSLPPLPSGGGLESPPGTITSRTLQW